MCNPPPLRVVVDCDVRDVHNLSPSLPCSPPLFSSPRPSCPLPLPPFIFPLPLQSPRSHQHPPRRTLGNCVLPQLLDVLSKNNVPGLSTKFFLQRRAVQQHSKYRSRLLRCARSHLRHATGFRHLSNAYFLLLQEKLAEDLSNCRAIESSLKEAFNSIKVCDATHPSRCFFVDVNG